MDTKCVYKMRPYMSISYTKYTNKIDNFVHIFVILVYKIGTKFDPKTTVPSKILIQNDYTKRIHKEQTKWDHICKFCIQNINTKLTFMYIFFAILVYKIGTKFDHKTTVPSKILIQNDYTK